MYRVIEMYGDYEPWWFLDGWEADVVHSETFENYYEALKFYKEIWVKFSERLPQYKSRSDLMTIFWDPTDQRWCEECDEFLQQYHSIALLENGQKIPMSKFRPGYSKQRGKEFVRMCRLKKK